MQDLGLKRALLLGIGITGIFLIILVILGSGDLLAGDSRLFTILNPGEGNSTMFDTFFILFTTWGFNLGLGIYFLIGIMVTLAVLSIKFKALRYLILLAGLGVLIFIGVDFLLQYLIVRGRPFFDGSISSNTLTLFPNAAEIFTNSSFPSFHVGLTFAILSPFILYRHYWAKGLALGYGLLTAYSRIFIGVHYPTDVFAGALVGFLIILALYPLFRRKLNGRKDIVLENTTRRLIDELEKLKN
jgi:membrane-associated phospholipid phosphatase